MNSKTNPIACRLKQIALLYIDGFRSMKVGKKLWLIVAIKFFIFFVIVKLLFFPDILKENFETDSARSNYILNQLTKGE